MKKIQISQELFSQLVGFHLLDNFAHEEAIKKALQEKLDQMIRHELYTKSKMASSEVERENARKQYLEQIGMRPDFRW